MSYKDELNKKPKDFIGGIIERSKGLPDSMKYSKVLKWTEEGVRDCPVWSKSKKVTVFTQAAKDSKGKPGPTSYNSHIFKDAQFNNIGPIKQ